MAGRPGRPSTRVSSGDNMRVLVPWGTRSKRGQNQIYLVYLKILLKDHFKRIKVILKSILSSQLL